MSPLEKFKPLLESFMEFVWETKLNAQNHKVLMNSRRGARFFILIFISFFII